MVSCGKMLGGLDGARPRLVPPSTPPIKNSKKKPPTRSSMKSIPSDRGLCRRCLTAVAAAGTGAGAGAGDPQAQGELAVREVFPEATIVRPARLFGNDDRLLTWIACMATRLSRVPVVREGRGGVGGRDSFRSDRGRS